MRLLHDDDNNENFEESIARESSTFHVQHARTTETTERNWSELKATTHDRHHNVQWVVLEVKGIHVSVRKTLMFLCFKFDIQHFVDLSLVLKSERMIEWNQKKHECTFEKSETTERV